MAGATVTVTSVDRNVSRTLTTDSSGAYGAPSLLPGTYTVRAEAKGFRAIVRENIAVGVGADIRVDFTMQPGEMAQTITVTEAVPLVETTNATLGGTLQSQVISNLPLNGRNFQNMLQLRPGVTIYPGGAGKSQSSNGNRPEDNVYMVNGVMASDPWVAQSVYGNVLAAGDQSTIMPVDAIDEFKLEMNPRAQYGWKPGAIVSVGIKSGTNAIHGSAYAYGRDTVFDARNYFNPAVQPAGVVFNADKQPVALEQFGGTLGGPIKKDKLFYFVNYESQRYDVGVPSAVVTPTQADLTTACLNAGANLAPVSAVYAGLHASGPDLCQVDSSLAGKSTDPSGLKFQGLFPVNDGSAGGRVFSHLTNHNVINGGLGKVDYHPNDKNQLEGMYFFSEGNNVMADAPVYEVSNSWITAQHARSQVASGGWTWTPSSNVVNDLRFGYAHNFWFFNGNDLSQDPANYTFLGNQYEFPTGVTDPIRWGAPRITLGGYYNGGTGDAIGILWPKILGPTSVTEFSDHVSVLHGKHAFMFGGEILLNTAIENETQFAKGKIKFSNLDQFMTGTVHIAFFFQGDPIRDLRNQGYAAFVQDDWRVKPRLTLNLGVRYEVNTVVHDRNGQLANFDPIRGMVQSDNTYHGDHNNFAPRLGFAWDISGDGKTVFRGGAGIIYETLVGLDVMNGVGNLLGLRTMPTGLPLFNAGSTTPLPVTGNIRLQAPTFAPGSGALTDLRTAWRNFNPNLPVAGQQLLFSSISNPACGDNFTTPEGYSAAPGQCEIYGVDPNLRTAYVSSWNLDIQRAITNNLSLDIGYVGNHGTKLLGALNINQPPPFSGWTADAKAGCLADYSSCGPDANAEQAAQPFTAPCASSIEGLGFGNSSGGPFNPTNSCLSYLSFINILGNNYVSNYHALQVTVTGRNFHGLTFTSGYTFSHTLAIASSQGTAANFPVPLNSYGNLHAQLYAPTDFDARHRFTLSMNYAIPGRKGFGQVLEGWSINSIVILTSGFPWGLADLTNDFSGTNAIGTSAVPQGEEWVFSGNPSDFTPVHGWTDTNLSGATYTGGLPYFPGTSNSDCLTKAESMGDLAVAALSNLGCYAVGSSVLVPPAYGSYGTTKPGTWRDAGFKNWDLSVSKMFTIKERLHAEGRVEFFNVLNHPIFVNPQGGPGGNTGGQDPSTGAGFGFNGVTNDTFHSNPQLGSGGARAMQLGLKLSW
jgi:hypothetical protein